MSGLRPRIPARTAWLLRDENGQGLLEFALVVPMLLLLLFGLLDIGRAVYINNAASEGAREGARWGSVQGRSSTHDDRADIEAKTKSVMTAVPNPNVTVRCERDGKPATACHTNDTLIVEVRADVGMLTPVIGQLVGPLKVSATSTVAVLQ